MAQHSKTKVAEVLHDYQNTDLTIDQIESKYKVSAPTIISWVKKAHLPLRGQGRRKKTQPDSWDKKVLALIQHMTLEAAAERMNTSKQNVFRVAKRWKDYSVDGLRPPFEPGDLLRWKKEKVCVVSAGVETGTVRDAQGRLIRAFAWTLKNRPTVVKIGHDPEFGLKVNGRAA